MPTLTHRQEFQDLLTNYQMSAEAKQALARVPVVTLTAITATGRNTIIRELVATGKFYFVVSDTTRPQRKNDGVLEQDGAEYWFRSEQDVLAAVRRGDLIAPAIIHSEQVSGFNFRELLIADRAHKIAITEIEAQGTDEVLRQVPGSLVPIFVLPPSYEEWMRRWSARGQTSDADKQNRINSARQELVAALEKDYYHFLINDDLAKAVSGVQKIVAGQIDPAHEAAGRQVAQDILHEIEAHHG